MQAVARIVSPRVPLYHRSARTITTTLYDLIEAIHDEVPDRRRETGNRGGCALA